MRRSKPASVAAVVALASTALAFVLGDGGCARPTTTPGGTGGGGSGGGGLGGVGGGTGGAKAGSSSSSGGGGFNLAVSSSSTSSSTGTGGGGGSNPCGSKCGPKELCDPDHVGLDDNCNGLVDEGCPCEAGEAHFCFPGDPQYHNVPGCFDGSEVCSEMGTWGECIGGFNATAADKCYLNDTMVCHAISSLPFQNVQLKDGLGTFGANAVTQSWTVACPAGVMPCPAVNGMNPVDDFNPIQSGEYTVTYTKTVAGSSAPITCSYPLFVGAPGLRVELTWEHTSADTGVDLDLHMHEPLNTEPWGFTPAIPSDCSYGNCRIASFSSPIGNEPHWFSDPPAMPPTPLNWWVYPVMANNTCYFAPKGAGALWQTFGQGCHNPRLDVDVITCDVNVLDPNDPNFCAPENTNVDFPPLNEWIRIGVHYYSNHGLSYDVHPRVKIFCDGALGADLGPSGYYMPQAPVTFASYDGAGVGNRFWAVADVAFQKDACHSGCVVKPLYSDAGLKTPFFTIAEAASAMFEPPYPAPLP